MRMDGRLIRIRIEVIWLPREESRGLRKCIGSHKTKQALYIMPSENRTEGDRIGTKQSGPFEAVPSASLIWTIYYRILKHIEARRRVCNYKEPIITISNGFIGFKMMIFKLKI
jgi:hypothetical protein